jgi:ACS family tartrate transporter-like MFS transporter
MLLYFFAFLDRVNISFAALTMNRDLGISERTFGLAAGIFFLGYCLFEIPSNVILIRVGARRWIAIIMILWGAISLATAFVRSQPLYVLLRFLLGAAEAGFYPGIILYLTFWLPSAVRSRLLALFITAIPISGMVGSPISAKILLLDQAGGLRGWQWLFLLEGAPVIILGVAVYALLIDNPHNASWLTDNEKKKILQDLAAEVPDRKQAHSTTRALQEPSVYGFSFAYFALMSGLYGVSFWAPRMLDVRGAHLGNIGWMTAIPYLVGVIGMLLWSHRSDQHQERARHLVTAYLIAATGLILAGLVHGVTGTIIAFSLSTLGVFAAMPVFWSASTLRMAGPMVGIYIAVINSIGNLGGFVSPTLIGWFVQTTHSFAAGLVAIAICLLCGGFTLYKLFGAAEL